MCTKRYRVCDNNGMLTHQCFDNCSPRFFSFILSVKLIISIAANFFCNFSCFWQNEIYIWLVSTFFLWFVLAIYFDNIIPNSAGVRKSLFYFLNPGYWTGKGGNKVEGEWICSSKSCYPLFTCMFVIVEPFTSFLFQRAAFAVAWGRFLHWKIWLLMMKTSLKRKTPLNGKLGRVWLIQILQYKFVGL